MPDYCLKFRFFVQASFDSLSKTNMEKRKLYKCGPSLNPAAENLYAKMEKLGSNMQVYKTELCPALKWRLEAASWNHLSIRQTLGLISLSDYHRRMSGSDSDPFYHLVLGFDIPHGPDEVRMANLGITIRYVSQVIAKSIFKFFSGGNQWKECSVAVS